MADQGSKQAYVDDNYSTHPLVTALGGTEVAPGTTRDAVTLLGYVGVTRNGIVQLFLDLDFETFLEIPTEAIIVAPRPLRSDDSNSPSVLVVVSTARIKVVSITSDVIEASYLKGSVSAAFLEGAATLAGEVRASPTTLTPRCTKPPVCSPG